MSDLHVSSRLWDSLPRLWVRNNLVDTDVQFNLNPVHSTSILYTRERRDPFPRSVSGRGFCFAPEKRPMRGNATMYPRHENLGHQPSTWRGIKTLRSLTEPPALDLESPGAPNLLPLRPTAMFSKAIIALASLAAVVNAIPHRRATCSNGQTTTNAAVSQFLL